VRGATLATTTTVDRNIPAARQPADADAVRAELDEFEAAVRRAEQDSAAPADPDNDRMTAVRENLRRPEGDGQ
jgi:hypothetical protein